MCLQYRRFRCGGAGWARDGRSAEARSIQRRSGLGPRRAERGGAEHPMAEFRKGMKVVHRAQSAWGVGHVLAVSDDPPRLSAQFPGRPGGPVMLSSRDHALVRFKFTPNSPAHLADGTPVRVLRGLAGPAHDLYRYTV